MQAWELLPARDLELPLLQSFRSLQRESGLLASGLRLGWRMLLRGYMAVWHRPEIRGLENVPKKPPFVLVANHQSHLDAPVLAACLPWLVYNRIFPIAAGEVFFGNPLRSVLAALFLNALPMWRRKCGLHGMTQLRRRLVEEPCGFILFPEGTRSRDGRMHPFKTGLGMLVAGTDVPVVPCYLHGTYEAMRPGRIFPWPRKIHLDIGKPMNFRDAANNRAGWEQIVAETHSAVHRVRCGRRALQAHSTAN